MPFCPSLPLSIIYLSSFRFPFRRSVRHLFSITNWMTPISITISLSASDTRIFRLPRMGRRILGERSFQYIGHVIPPPPPPAPPLSLSLTQISIDCFCFLLWYYSYELIRCSAASFAHNMLTVCSQYVTEWCMACDHLALWARYVLCGNPHV